MMFSEERQLRAELVCFAAEAFLDADSIPQRRTHKVDGPELRLEYESYLDALERLKRCIAEWKLASMKGDLHVE